MLFSFRKSHKSFFTKLKANCLDRNMIIVSSKDKILPSFSGYNELKYIDLSPACRFAVDEFYAHSEIRIPKIIIQSLFSFLAYVNYFRYFKLIDTKFDKILIWNGGKFRQLIAIEIAKIKNIDVCYFENGLLPNRLTFDTKGINFNNSAPRDIEFYKNYQNKLDLPNKIVQRIGKGKDKFIGKKNGLPEKYIFVPFQVDYDTQILTNSKWVKNMRMLFDIIEKMPSSINFVFKEHPSSGLNYNDLHERSSTLDNIMFANTHLTQELIQSSQAVITINSTVGIESLLFHKKVIVLGDAFYKIEGLTYGVDNLKELNHMVKSIFEYKLNSEIVDNFLKYLYYDYLIPNDEDVYDAFCERLKYDN